MRRFAPAMLGFLALSATAHAGDGLYFRPYVGGGAEFGGDTIATLGFAGGDTQDIDAGHGVWIAGGLNFRPFRASRVGLRTGVGYKYLTTQATNVDVHISRVTMELMPYWRFNEAFWVSVGAVKHDQIKLETDSFNLDDEFSSNVGPRIEVGWRFIGLSYTSLEYTSSITNARYRADNFGVFLTTAFGGSCCRKAALPTPPAPTYMQPMAQVPAPEPAGSTHVAAAPIAAPVAPEAPVAPATSSPDLVMQNAGPLLGNTAFARNAAQLHTGPSTKVSVIATLQPGALVKRLNTLKFGNTIWWDADVDGVGRGWIMERDLRTP